MLYTLIQRKVVLFQMKVIIVSPKKCAHYKELDQSMCHLTSSAEKYIPVFWLPQVSHLLEPLGGLGQLMLQQKVSCQTPTADHATWLQTPSQELSEMRWKNLSSLKPSELLKMSIKSKFSACIVEINNYKLVNKISLRPATNLYCQFHLSFFVLCSMCMYVTWSFKIIIY